MLIYNVTKRLGHVSLYNIQCAADFSIQKFKLKDSHNREKYGHQPQNVRKKM